MSEIENIYNDEDSNNFEFLNNLHYNTFLEKIVLTSNKGKYNNVSKEDNSIQMEDEQKKSIQIKAPKKDQSDKEIIYTLDSFDNSMPVSVRNDINIVLNQLKDTEDNSFIDNLRDILFSTNQKNISPYERNKINQLYIKNRFNPIKNLINVKLSIIKKGKYN